MASVLVPPASFFHMAEVSTHFGMFGEGLKGSKQAIAVAPRLADPEPSNCVVGDAREIAFGRPGKAIFSHLGLRAAFPPRPRFPELSDQ